MSKFYFGQQVKVVAAAFEENIDAIGHEGFVVDTDSHVWDYDEELDMKDHGRYPIEVRLTTMPPDDQEWYFKEWELEPVILPGLETDSTEEGKVL